MDFPGPPVVKTLPPLQGVRAQSNVREPRSHIVLNFLEDFR